MRSTLLAPLAAAVLMAASSSVLCGPGHAVQGEKVDSGLGALPPYSQWADKTGRHPTAARVVGESLDSGLGALPHYSLWKDRTGRDPMGLTQTQVEVASR